MRSASLTTSVTKVSSLLFPTFPVTSQHPTVGKISIVAWNPMSPYPSGIHARRGGAGASSLFPSIIINLPRVPRHHPNFMLNDPSGSTNPGADSVLARACISADHGTLSRLQTESRASSKRLFRPQSGRAAAGETCGICPGGRGQRSCRKGIRARDRMRARRIGT